MQEHPCHYSSSRSSCINTHSTHSPKENISGTQICLNTSSDLLLPVLFQERKYEPAVDSTSTGPPHSAIAVSCPQAPALPEPLLASGICCGLSLLETDFACGVSLLGMHLSSWKALSPLGISVHTISRERLS